MVTSQILTGARNRIQDIFVDEADLDSPFVYEDGCTCTECGGEIKYTCFFSKAECLNCGSSYEEDCTNYFEEYYA